MLSNAALRNQIFAASIHRASILEQETLSLHRLHPKSLHRQANRQCFTTQNTSRPFQSDSKCGHVKRFNQEHRNAGEVNQNESQPLHHDNSIESTATIRKKFGKHGTKKGMLLSEYRQKQRSNLKYDVLSRARTPENGSSNVLTELPASSQETAGEISTESILPTSPLELTVKESPWTPKDSYVKPNDGPLASNPWAIMLASSVRQDNSSSIRFPARLLMKYDEVKNPIDKKAYLLPDEVSDLAAFNARLQHPKKLKAHSTSQSKTLVRLLPYKRLLDDLGKSLRKWDDLKMSWTTKKSALAGRLYHFGLTEAATKYEGYRKASNGYWAVKKKLEAVDEEVFKPPPDYPDHERTQWDSNISTRLIDVLRQRVLLTLKKVLQRDDRNDKGIYNTIILDLPNQPSDIVDFLPTLTLLGKTDHWNDMGDIEVSGAISGKNPGQGSATDPRPPIAIQPVELMAEEDQPNQDPRKWLPGSIILHTGAFASLLPAIPTSGSGKPFSKYVPPMITVAGKRRIPVFNMQALLGPVFTPYLVQILREYPNFAITSTADQDAAFLGDRIIVVKSVAMLGPWLTEEIWQLWRYLGGTDCFFPRSEGSTYDDVPDHVNKDKADELLRQTIYSGPSENTLKHFEELLNTPKGKTWYRTE